jgi:hypothetical protein
VARDEIFHLCAEMPEKNVWLADLIIRYNDFSLYVIFKDEINTELHLHPTGAITLKLGRKTLQSINLPDPLLQKSSRKFGRYKLRNIKNFPDASQLDVEKVILMTQESTIGARALEFGYGEFSADKLISLVKIGIRHVYSLTIQFLKDELATAPYETGIHPFCELTLEDRLDKHINEGVRYIEINKILRDSRGSGVAEISSVVPESPMFRPPNSQGVGELIFEVPMRTMPTMTASFLDPRFRVLDCGVHKKSFNMVSRKFKVVDSQTGLVFMGELPPYDFKFEAEL